jgi:large subunit ribosomal protein L29
MKSNEKVKELKAKSSKWLKAKKIDLLTEQFSLRMQKGTGQLKKNHMFKNIRRDIARINTVLSDKQKPGAIE